MDEAFRYQDMFGLQLDALHVWMSSNAHQESEVTHLCSILKLRDWIAFLHGKCQFISQVENSTCLCSAVPTSLTGVDEVANLRLIIFQQMVELSFVERTVADKVSCSEYDSHDLSNGLGLGTQSVLLHHTVKVLHFGRDFAHAREVHVGLLQPLCDCFAHGASGGTNDVD